MIPDLYDRKMGFKELLMASWWVFKTHFRQLLLFCFGVNLCLIFLNHLVGIFLSDTLGYNGMRFFGQLPEMIFNYVPELGAIIITTGAAKSQLVSGTRVFREIRGLFVSGLVISLCFLIFHTGLMVLSFLFSKEMIGVIAPIVSVFIGIFYFAMMVYLLFVNQALAICGRRGTSAFVYSWKTVRGRWWSVFCNMFLLGLIVALPLVLQAWILKTVVSEVLLGVLRLFYETFGAIFITILFLNIDREGIKLVVDELKYPVDPVILSKKLS